MNILIFYKQKKSLENINGKIICTLIFLACFCHYALIAQTLKTSEKDTLKAIKTQVFIEGAWESFILGDINSDNIIDTAFIYTPGYYGTQDQEYPKEPPMFDSCLNNLCYNKITFSCNLPEIYNKNTLWGTVEMIDDLDEDGINEIIFQTNWWIGTHVEMYIYSYHKGEWRILAKNWLYGEDSLKYRVKKINKNKFRLKVEYMDTKVHDIKEKYIIVKIIK
ncbi:MAG: hypothetical protein ACOYO1_16915 [Bacteroidales bacterium]